ncbi:MAG: sugar ABC transporter ATP-binding protein [Lachnospiraceae bacterium]|nr:sugar ABC transporter ATP-binding protein [Lachnospiraceae bacterium]
MGENFLEVKYLNKHFGGVQALCDVSLEIKKGEIHCLCGENGSGKSTLIKAVSGVYKPDGGTIVISGKEYGFLAPKDAILEGIQVIYQDFAIFPNLTVAENIAVSEGLRNSRKFVNRKFGRKLAKEALQMLGIELDLDTRLEDLSVANKQIVAIARAVINDAKMLIMDEPTTALTGKEVRILFQLIKKMQASGMSVLFVSHKLEEVFEIAERFTILRNGKKIITIDKKELTREKFLYYMTGRTFQEVPYEADSHKDKTPLLEVKGLTKKNAFKDINFRLYSGEILCISGLLGSGRTELAKALFGEYRPDSGSICLEGKAVQFKSIEDAISKGIGYVPEDRLTEGLFLKQSIERNINILHTRKLTNRYGRIMGPKMGQYAGEQVDKFGIVIGGTTDKISTLSGGNQQKCVLARWISNEPKVLILNGPTVGVDIAAKFDIFKILRKKAAEGLGILVISDDISEIAGNCSRVLIMREGRITGEYKGSELNEERLSGLLVES